MNIEAVQTDMFCIPGIVNQLCDEDYTHKRYQIGYQWQYVRQTIGQLTVNQLKQHGITLGKKYGGRGIDLRVLLSQPADDSFYEVSAKQLLMSNWSANKLQKLFNKHKLIIHDFGEGGFYIDQLKIMYREQLSKSRFVVYSYVSHWPADSNEHNMHFETIIYGAGTYYQNVDFVEDNNNIKEVLIPVHKARSWRTDTLAMFDEAGLLDKADWSLYKITKGESTRYGDFTHSPALVNMMHDHIYHNARIDKFLKRYSFPRMIDNVDNFSDHMLLKNTWKNYKWYVSIETHCDRLVITEKTLKGFVLGVPTISISAKGYNQYLASLGFQVENYDDTSNSLEDRVKNAIEYINTHKGDKEKADYNRQLLMDNQFLSSLIVEPLLKLKREIGPTRQ